MKVFHRPFLVHHGIMWDGQTQVKVVSSRGRRTPTAENGIGKHRRYAGKDNGQIRRDDVGIVPYESEFVGVAFSKTAS